MQYAKVMSAVILAAALTPAGQAFAGAEHTMTGCLAKEGDGFALTDVAGNVKHVAIAESSADLAGHVGHKVEITGVTVPGKDAKTHTMKVSAMKHVDSKCP